MLFARVLPRVRLPVCLRGSGGQGVCGSDYNLEEHVNVRRPIYPLELDAPPLSEEEAKAQSLTLDARAEE